MSSVVYILVQLIIVLLMLAAMVMLLMGIHHFFRGEDSATEAADLESLRQEVEERDEVMSDHNLFHRFLVRDSQCSPRTGRKATVASRKR